MAHNGWDCEQHTYLRIRQTHLRANQGPGRLPGAEHELVQQPDREKREQREIEAGEAIASIPGHAEDSSQRHDGEYEYRITRNDPDTVRARNSKCVTRPNR